MRNKIKILTSVVPKMVRRGFNLGYCSICEKRTLFYKEGDWLRDQYRCIRCKSIPRFRALIHIVQEYFPNWRHLTIHESSPAGPTFNKFKSECKNYVPTQYFPNITLGKTHKGFRCEDLRKQTFKDESFDLVITQDVLEHLFYPSHALREIHRTLKPGGTHVFTVPWYYWQETRIRARKNNCDIEYLEEPDYHGNPVNANGSLVVTEWGRDLCDTIYESCGMMTTAIQIRDKRLGIEAKFIEVFISTKRDYKKEGLTNRWRRT